MVLVWRVDKRARKIWFFLEAMWERHSIAFDTQNKSRVPKTIEPISTKPRKIKSISAANCAESASVSGECYLSCIFGGSATLFFGVVCQCVMWVVFAERKKRRDRTQHNWRHFFCVTISFIRTFCVCLCDCCCGRDRNSSTPIHVQRCSYRKFVLISISRSFSVNTLCIAKATRIHFCVQKNCTADWTI